MDPGLDRRHARTSAHRDPRRCRRGSTTGRPGHGPRSRGHHVAVLHHDRGRCESPAARRIPRERDVLRHESVAPSPTWAGARQATTVARITRKAKHRRTKRPRPPPWGRLPLSRCARAGWSGWLAQPVRRGPLLASSAWTVTRWDSRRIAARARRLAPAMRLAALPTDELPDVDTLFTFMRDAELRFQTLRMRIEERTNTTSGPMLVGADVCSSAPTRSGRSPRARLRSKRHGRGLDLRRRHGADVRRVPASRHGTTGPGAGPGRR